ncbi:GTP cyclohydrolase I [Pavlovales sp. CCMP2436]|nr:GTP cyclohydrolase I [Pavlovales sp. CCMP2436]
MATARPTRKRERMEEAVRTLLECLGEDPEREGLRDTPKRMAKALLDCTGGYQQTAASVVGDAIFNEESCGDMVIVRDIPVHSLCEHHMLPFMGKAHVGYIPDGKVIGLSKIGRIVEVFSRRLQVQERLTQQIANALAEQLGAKGVGVVVECTHMCMAMRGVRQLGALTTTRALLGEMRTDPQTRNDFMSMLGRS